MIRITKKKTFKGKPYIVLVIATQYPHETCWIEGALTMLNSYYNYCKFHILCNENGEAIIGLSLFSAWESNIYNVTKMLNRK